MKEEKPKESKPEIPSSSQPQQTTSQSSLTTPTSQSLSSKPAKPLKEIAKEVDIEDKQKRGKGKEPVAKAGSVLAEKTMKSIAKDNGIPVDLLKLLTKIEASLKRPILEELRHLNQSFGRLTEQVNRLGMSGGTPTLKGPSERALKRVSGGEKTGILKSAISLLRESRESEGEDSEENGSPKGSLSGLSKAEKELVTEYSKNKGISLKASRKHFDL